MLKLFNNIRTWVKNIQTRIISKKKNDSLEEIQTSEDKRLSVHRPTGLRDLELWEEDEIIENISDKIVEYGIDLPSIILLQSITPLSEVISGLFILPVSPVLDFFGISGYIAASFFQKRENLARLTKRIEEKESKKKDKFSEKNSKH